MRHIRKANRTLVVILCFSIISGFQPFTTSGSVQPVYSKDRMSDVTLAAFEILKAKCNVCHLTQNPKKVFTMDNMNLLAPKIYKQVFVKKRMPLGKTIRLSEGEYNTLKDWLVTQNLIN